MNMIRKLLIIFVFTCAASFSQQLGSTSKSVSQVSSTTITVAVNNDSQKQLKKVVSVKRTPTTWTKIKDLFM